MEWVPDYYGAFHCIADACVHSCCRGWEIDIDDASRARYEAMPGEMGERIRRAMAEEDGVAFFRLEEDGACPFLRQDGLCGMICACGEEALCDICRDHPRYRSFFTGRTETGLGLVCEEAARVILGWKEKTRLVPLAGGGAPEDAEEDMPEEEKELLAVRDDMIRIAQDRSLSVSARADALARRYRLARFGSAEERRRVLMPLERLDGGWTEKLNGMTGKKVPLPEEEIPLEQLLVCFLTRHVPRALDERDIAAWAAFALFSFDSVRDLFMAEKAKKGTLTVDDMAFLARMYSGEIEYSDENTDAIAEKLNFIS